MQPREMHGRWIPLVLLVITIAGGGCTTADPVEADDQSVIFPLVRMTWQIQPQDRATLADTLAGVAEAEVEEGPDQSRGQFSLAIDFDVSYGAGDDDQTLGPLDEIELDNMDFLGPGVLEVDYDIYVWTLAVRLGGWVRRVVAFEWIGGWTVTNLGIQLRMGGIKETDTDIGWGPSMGGRITGRPIGWLDLYLQLLGNAFWGGDIAGSFSQFEIGAVIEPVPGLGIVAGWRSLVYRSDRVDESDFRLDYTGPALGLRLTF